MNEFQTHTLPNGIRLIHHTVQSPVAYCGIIINTGSRDEMEHQHGLAHFIEHLIFKGTTKRKAYSILSRIEDVGGELNAYTTKEETCIFATFFNNYYSRAFELISDIVFNSIFPEKEIQTEKEVIIDEIHSYKDVPFEAIYDDFEELVFNPNPMARNILGTTESLNSFSRSDLISFYTSNYATSEMVVSSVSMLPFKKVRECFIKYFNPITPRNRIIPRIKYEFDAYSTTRTRIKQNTYQAHCILGNQAYSMNDNKKLPLHLINCLLAGNAMNSRLNMTLREKKGLAYNIESNYSSYSDTGIFHVYFGTALKNLDQCIELTYQEFRKIREKLLSTDQLHRIKKQLIGQVAISVENKENLMLSIGRSLLFFDRVETLEELTLKIEEISSSLLRDVSNELFHEDQLSSMIYY